MTTPALIVRHPCPPGACDCERERLLATPGADLRILRLTREEEKRLVARLETLSSLEDLQHMQARMAEQLGLRVEVTPGANEVRTMRGFRIEVLHAPGLCRKSRQAIPAAIRRALEQRPEIAWALLDAEGLFGGAG